MLIKNNFIDSKQIIIDVIKNIIYIESCNVIVNINIKIIKIVIRERMQFRKISDVLFQSEITISVHHTIILVNKDFFLNLMK